MDVFHRTYVQKAALFFIAQSGIISVFIPFPELYSPELYQSPLYIIALFGKCVYHRIFVFFIAFFLRSNTRIFCDEKRHIFATKNNIYDGRKIQQRSR